MNDPGLIHSAVKGQSTLHGEYIFSRQEMVAGFKFEPGNRFQFYYSYGAVDRSATGSYSISGNVIKLISDKTGGKDFTLVSQSKQGHSFHISCKDSNKNILKYINCIAFAHTIPHQYSANDEGEISFELADCEKIYIRHELFVDIPTLVKDSTNSNNHFIYKLNPSLSQVSFQDIDLKLEDENTISCLPNYFIPLEGIRFIKD